MAPQGVFSVSACRCEILDFSRCSNLGKGFSPEEAKLSGLMESLEMCCIESLIPSEWYDPSFKPLIEASGDITEASNVRLLAFVGAEKSINFNELIVQNAQHEVKHAKSFTNGLASGQFLMTALCTLPMN